jgi:hypothetical protein
MPVMVRTPRPGDGAGMARVWLSAAAYYAALDPGHFQIPPEDGLAESFEASLGTGGEDELMLAADLDGRVAGWWVAPAYPRAVAPSRSRLGPCDAEVTGGTPIPPSRRRMCLPARKTVPRGH